ncbi:MAG: hypothetical protein EX260_07890 [Desulfobulbaceae bacterium]|nr:MAG: hypothetical protein EX260_07890 [Desulfobulbaceae bacterium]
MADESVVVMKFRPVKAGNSVEDKTGMTRHQIVGGRYAPKAVSVAKGRSSFKETLNACMPAKLNTSCPTGQGTLSAVDRDW